MEDKEFIGSLPTAEEASTAICDMFNKDDQSLKEELRHVKIDLYKVTIERNEIHLFDLDQVLTEARGYALTFIVNEITKIKGANSILRTLLEEL